MASANTSISPELTATGASASVVGTPTSVKIAGTFVATVKVQIKDAHDNWINLKDTSGTEISMTAPDTWTVDTGVSEEVRVNCTAYTSGTIEVDIKALQ